LGAGIWHKRSVDNVHTLGFGHGRTAAGLARMPDEAEQVCGGFDGVSVFMRFDLFWA
jgi:hypothetical protein